MSKQVVRTEAAPAPFQGAPYNQAIVANGFVFVAGQLGLEPGAKRDRRRAGSGRRPSRCSRTCAAILEAAGSSLDAVVKTTVFLRTSTTSPAMNEVYATPHRRDAARTLDRRGRPAARRRARRDRGDRPRSSCRWWNSAREGDRGLRPLARARRVPRRRRRARRAARARVEGRRLPRPRRRRRRAARGARAARAGRGARRRRDGRSACGSTRATGRSGRSRRPGSSSRRRGASARPGPGGTTSRSSSTRRRASRTISRAATSRSTRWRVASPTASSSTRSAAAPTSRRGVLRTVSPRSFAEDPLRIVRGLRFVSQLGLEPDEATLGQMRENAAAVALVSGERIGGGLAADGMGELSKLLLGARAAQGAAARARHRRARRAAPRVRAGDRLRLALERPRR